MEGKRWVSWVSGLQHYPNLMSWETKATGGEGDQPAERQAACPHQEGPGR